MGPEHSQGNTAEAASLGAAGAVSHAEKPQAE
jgi:hypothetical protein